MSYEWVVGRPCPLCDCMCVEAMCCAAFDMLGDVNVLSEVVCMSCLHVNDTFPMSVSRVFRYNSPSVHCSGIRRLIFLHGQA